LEDPRGSDVQRLAEQRAGPAGVRPESSLAQPMDVGRVAGLSARRLAERRLLPDGPLRPRRTLLPDRGGRGSGPLFPRLQPRPGGADHASPTRPLPVRHGLSPALLLPAATGPPADPQGPADLPPRPGPVVPVFDLLRTPRLLFPEHPAAGI